MTALPHCTNLPLSAIHYMLEEMGQPSYRYNQFLYWVFKKRIDSFDQMSNVPKEFRKRCVEQLEIAKPEIHYCIESKNQDAVKFGFATKDTSGIYIESVLLFDESRRTLCISSQLGCSLGCVFCATGQLGFKRNLTQQEMISQLICANDYLARNNDKLVTNIVFMGMGEALLNFDTLISVIEIITSNDCFCIGGRRITVSTAGVIPAIQKFMKQDLNVGLAISLNSTSNEQRSRLMPINCRYPIESLIQTAKEWYSCKKDPVTFEYVLISGETDTKTACSELIALLRNIPCKINLIPLNPFPDSKLISPASDKFDSFAQRLREADLQVTLRRSKGQDITAACGQLSFSGFKQY